MNWAPRASVLCFLMACGGDCPPGFEANDDGECAPEMTGCPDGQVLGEAGFCVDVVVGQDSDGPVDGTDDTEVSSSDTDAPDTDATLVDSDVSDTDAGPEDTDMGDTDSPDEADTGGGTIVDTGSVADTADTGAALDTGSAAGGMDTAGDTGLALPGASVRGNAYVVDMSSVNFVRPPAAVAGALMSNLSSTGALEVTGVTATTLDLLLAAYDPTANSQITTIQTIPLSGVDFTNVPQFSYAVPALTLSLFGQSVELYDVEMSGAFSRVNAQIVNGRLTGLLDTRPLAAAAFPSGSPSTICTLLILSGGCVPCPGGTGTFCAEVDAQGIVANEDPALSLVPVTSTAPGATCATVATGPVPWSLTLVCGAMLLWRREE